MLLYAWAAFAMALAYMLAVIIDYRWISFGMGMGQVVGAVIVWVFYSKAVSKIEKLNDKLTPDQTMLKQYLNLNGCCEGAVIEKTLQTISGGFISFNKDLALITDVFTKEKYRGQGYGKAIVKKLLTLSPRKDVYLVSRDYNVKFYEKIGFKVAKEIYEYKV